MIKQFTTTKFVLDILRDTIREGKLPIAIETGQQELDHNGDVQIDCLAEFDEDHLDTFNDVLNRSVTEAYELLIP